MFALVVTLLVVGSIVGSILLPIQLFRAGRRSLAAVSLVVPLGLIAVYGYAFVSIRNVLAPFTFMYESYHFSASPKQSRKLGVYLSPVEVSPATVKLGFREISFESAWIERSYRRVAKRSFGWQPKQVEGTHLCLRMHANSVPWSCYADPCPDLGYQCSDAMGWDIRMGSERGLSWAYGKSWHRFTDDVFCIKMKPHEPLPSELQFRYRHTDTGQVTVNLHYGGER